MWKTCKNMVKKNNFYPILSDEMSIFAREYISNFWNESSFDETEYIKNMTLTKNLRILKINLNIFGWSIILCEKIKTKTDFGK